jgi:hypothetical protein
MNLKAILIGVTSYPILWAIWFFITPQYEHKALHAYSVVMSAFYILMPFISGYITAYFAKTKGIQHGLVFAIIVASLSMLGWYILDILTTNMLLNLFSIILLGTAGGAAHQGIKYYLNKHRQ